MTPNTPALPSASTELAAIRDAISAGPTPGPWHYYTLGGQSPADVPAGGHLIELPRIHQDRSVAMRVEDARRIGVPLVKPRNAEPDWAPEANPVIAVCGLCGRDVRRVEGYSCSQSRCPIQPKAY